MANDQATAALLAELQKLNRTVASQGSMGAGSEVKGRGGDTVDSKDILDSMKNLEEQNQRAARVQKMLSKSSNAYIKQLGKSANSLEKLREIQSKRTEENLKSFIELRKQYRAGNVDLKTYREQVKQLGFSNDDLRKSNEQLAADFTELHTSLQHLDHRIDDTAKSGGKLAAVWATLVAVGKEVYDVQTTSMRTGVEETAQQALQARMMGMSQVDLIEVQGQYRQTIESAGVSTTAFAAMMQSSSTELFHATGDLKAGAIFAAESLQTLRQVGAGMAGTDFLEKQEKTFLQLNKTLSITHDQFKEMNAQLRDSSAVRLQMFKMNKQRRAQHFLELQQTQAKLILDGLTIEQAQKVIEVFEEMGGQSAKDRLKQAAKLQAVMGSMGMGAEGAEAADLLRGGLRGEGDKARFAELMKVATEGVQQRLGSDDISSQMAMETMLERAGLTNLFQQDMAEVVLREDMGVSPDNVKDNASNTNELLQKILEWTQRTANFIGEGNISAILAGITGMALALGGKGLFGKLLSGGKGVFGKLGGAASSIMGTLKNLGGKGMNLLRGGAGLARSGGQLLLRGGSALLGTAAGSVAAAGAGGYAVGTGINKAWEHFDPESHRKMSDAVGGTIAQIVDTSFSETMDSTLSFWGNKIRGLWGDSDADRREEERIRVEQEAAMKRAEEARKQQDALERIATAAETTNQLTGEQTRMVERTSNEQMNLQSEMFQAGQSRNRSILMPAPRANMATP